jgi:hypothetical protein
MRKSDDLLCLPPDGTADGTRHVLSTEVGDGTKRQEFEAVWISGLWKVDGIHGLSPRKAAWASWEYVRSVADV